MKINYENTYFDLEIILNTLKVYGGIIGLEKLALKKEKRYIRPLVELCTKISEEFDDKKHLET